MTLTGALFLFWTFHQEVAVERVFSNALLQRLIALPPGTFSPTGILKCRWKALLLHDIRTTILKNVLTAIFNALPFKPSYQLKARLLLPRRCPSSLFKNTTTPTLAIQNQFISFPHPLLKVLNSRKI